MWCNQSKCPFLCFNLFILLYNTSLYTSRTHAQSPEISRIVSRISTARKQTCASSLVRLGADYKRSLWHKPPQSAISSWRGWKGSKTSSRTAAIISRAGSGARKRSVLSSSSSNQNSELLVGLTYHEANDNLISAFFRHSLISTWKLPGLTQISHLWGRGTVLPNWSKILRGFGGSIFYHCGSI